MAFVMHHSVGAFTKWILLMLKNRKRSQIINKVETVHCPRWNARHNSTFQTTKHSIISHLTTVSFLLDIFFSRLSRQSFAPIETRHNQTALYTMCWSLEVEWAVLILARRWRESFWQQLLKRINGIAGVHTIWAVRFTLLKLTMLLSVSVYKCMVHFYVNNRFMQITGMRLTGLFSSHVNGFGLGF